MLTVLLFDVDSVVDTAGNRRRLHLSTSQREVNATPLNARIPLVGVLVGSVSCQLFCNFMCYTTGMYVVVCI